MCSYGLWFHASSTAWLCPAAAAGFEASWPVPCSLLSSACLGKKPVNKKKRERGGCHSDRSESELRVRSGKLHVSGFKSYRERLTQPWESGATATRAYKLSGNCTADRRWAGKNQRNECLWQEVQKERKDWIRSGGKQSDRSEQIFFGYLLRFQEEYGSFFFHVGLITRKLMGIIINKKKK